MRVASWLSDEHGARPRVEENPERVNSERRSKWQDEQVESPQPEHGEPAMGPVPAQGAPGPDVGTTAGEKHNREREECAGRNAGGHSVGPRRHADGESAHGQQQHGNTEHEPNRTPDELKNAQQVKMRAHEKSVSGQWNSHAAVRCTTPASEGGACQP